MTDQNTSWFHCGRCGTLFRSLAGEQEDRLCTNCGSNPSLGIEPQPTNVPELRTALPPRREEHSSGREKHSHRKRRESGLVFKLIAGTLLLMGAIVGTARLFWAEESSNTTPSPPLAAQTVQVSEEDQSLLNDEAPKCADIFSSYVSAPSPEARNQFVQSPVTTASHMARFYSTNPVTRVDPTTLRMTAKSVLPLPGSKALEIRWQTTDGKLLDAVFMNQDGDWNLDWEHHVRYSDIPWALYLAGSGEDEAEFRLLARERLADERKDASDISVVLYAPRFGYPNETGFVSPEFLVPKAGENGRKLETAFKLEREGKQPFGVKLPSINPEGLIRVRVKVRRIVENMERRFELKEVIACHWYSTDAPGMEPPSQPEDK